MKHKIKAKATLLLVGFRNWYSTPIHIGERTLYSLHYQRIGGSLVGTSAALVMVALFSIDHPFKRFGSWIGMTAEASTLKPSELAAQHGARHSGGVHAKKEEYEIALVSNSAKDLSKNNFLRVTLINELDTSNDRSPIVFRVLETFDRRIPEGALAFGAVDDAKEDRIYGKVFAIKTGEQGGFEVEGEILSTDGSSGLKGDVRTNRESTLAGTAIGSFVAGAAAGLIHNSPFQIGGFQENVRNSLLAGTSETAGKAAEIYTDDLKNKKPTVRVARGSNAVILIKSF